MTAALQQLHWLAVELTVQCKLFFITIPSVFIVSSRYSFNLQDRTSLSPESTLYFIPRCGIFWTAGILLLCSCSLESTPPRLHNMSNFVTIRKHLKAYHLLVFISDNAMTGWKTRAQQIVNVSIKSNMF